MTEFLHDHAARAEPIRQDDAARRTHARPRAEHWCREVAGMRVHGTTRKVPRELFESVEEAAMRAPPTEPFDVPRWIDDAKVHPNHHVQVACALYSVPTLYLHKQVRVRANRASTWQTAGQNCATHAAAIRARRPTLRDAREFEERGGQVMTTATPNPELVTALERLKLGPIAETLPERLALADKQGMTFDDALLLILTDVLRAVMGFGRQPRA